MEDLNADESGWNTFPKNKITDFEIYIRKSGSFLSPKIPITKTIFQFDPDVSVNAILDSLYTASRMDWDEKVLSLFENEALSSPHLIYHLNTFKSTLGAAKRVFYERTIIIHDRENQRVVLYTNSDPDEEVIDSHMTDKDVLGETLISV